MLLRRAIKSSYACFPTEVVLINIFMPTAATIAATMNKKGQIDTDMGMAASLKIS